MRLVTRGDFDGLTSAVIITNNENIEKIALIHPQDITDNRVEIQKTDILANLPYHPNCAKWFDHHLQTENNPKPPEKFDGAYGLAPSAAGLVYEYYGGKAKMPELEDLVQHTDRLDSARLTRDEVLDPKGYILLGYTIDSRSGHGSFEEYFHLLLDLLKTKPIGEILEHPVVKERCERMRTDDSSFREALLAHSRVEGNVVVTDFRNLEQIPTGNRFLVYALYPDVNVSVRMHWGPQRRFIVAAVGHSIFNRSCNINVGEMMSRYGGGGHHGAGTTPLPPEQIDAELAKMVEELISNGCGA
jgi:oligoribonuclease NrnB/cAMP/cGMP phosphodiesterase (DHH superfamily)